MVMVIGEPISSNSGPHRKIVFVSGTVHDRHYIIVARDVQLQLPEHMWY